MVAHMKKEWPCDTANWLFREHLDRWQELAPERKHKFTICSHPGTDCVIILSLTLQGGQGNCFTSIRGACLGSQGPTLTTCGASTRTRTDVWHGALQMCPQTAETLSQGCWQGGHLPKWQTCLERAAWWQSGGFLLDEKQVQHEVHLMNW